MKWGIGALAGIASCAFGALLYMDGFFPRHFPKTVSGIVEKEAVYTPRGQPLGTGRIYTIRSGRDELTCAAIGTDPFNVGDDITVKLGEEVSYMTIRLNLMHADGSVEIDQHHPREIVGYR